MPPRFESQADLYYRAAEEMGTQPRRCVAVVSDINGYGSEAFKHFKLVLGSSMPEVGEEADQAEPSRWLVVSGASRGFCGDVGRSENSHGSMAVCVEGRVVLSVWCTGRGGEGIWYDTLVCFGLQLAAPIGRSPLSALVGPLPSVVPDGLSSPCVFPLPPWPTFPSPNVSPCSCPCPDRARLP